MVDSTVLVVVVTNAADAAAVADWMAPSLDPADVVRAAGYHAAVAAIDRGARAVVVDVGVPAGLGDWRLAEIRARRPEAAVVVVADAVLLARLAATVRADLAVTHVEALPPLRETLVTDEPVLRRDQTSRRRSTR